MWLLLKDIRRFSKKLSKNKHDNIEYYVMMLPVLALIFIFSYIPLYGLIIAFQNYVPGKSFFGPSVRWVGFQHFEKFIRSFYFARIVRNTLTLSVMRLLMGFWLPILFALLLNEIRVSAMRKIIQTLSYMPYFISSVVVAGMVISFITNDGIIVKALNMFGLRTVNLNVNKTAFKWIYTLTCVWQEFGWSSILYLSAISSIDSALYEAAEIDGASRAQQIIHITFPHMLPLIMIQLILSVGGLLGSNAEMILLLYNPSIYETSDVIGTYVYREGLLGAKYSYGAAVDLLMSVFGFALMYGANLLARKTTDYSLW